MLCYFDFFKYVLGVYVGKVCWMVWRNWRIIFLKIVVIIVLLKYGFICFGLIK